MATHLHCHNSHSLPSHGWIGYMGKNFAQQRDCENTCRRVQVTEGARGGRENFQ